MLRFTNVQRMKLAVKARILGRRLLDGFETLVTPDTLLAWQCKLIAKKWTYAVHAQAARFTTLDQLRGCLPHARSLLMDRATLLAFKAQWGVEENQTRRDLPRLNAEECALHDDLRDNRLSQNLRLEQERIGFGWVETTLAALDTGPDDHVINDLQVSF